jgi:AraC-like DNA-binding protein
MKDLNSKQKISFYAGWQQLCAALDCPVDTLLSTAGLPPELAEQEHAELTREQFFRFWNTLQGNRSTRELAECFLGLFERALPAPYLAALCSRNLRTGLPLLERFKRVLAPKHMTLIPEDGGLCVECHWHSEEAPPSMYFVNLCLLRLLAEKGTGRKVIPLRAVCPGAQNFPDSMAKELLGVSLSPGPSSRLTFADADLDADFNTKNPVTLSIIENSLQQKVLTNSKQITEQVTLALKRLFPDQRHSIENVAEELACSPRTLQRRLLEEGTTFKEVCNQTRRDLACIYLRQVRFSPKETSFLLGYSDPSSFYRAFRRWTNQSPSAFAGKCSA